MEAWKAALHQRCFARKKLGGKSGGPWPAGGGGLCCRGVQLSGLLGMPGHPSNQNSPLTPLRTPPLSTLLPVFRTRQVLELCSGGELVAATGKQYSERTAASFLRAVLRTVAQCHAKRIIHRDIKPENVGWLGCGGGRRCMVWLPEKNGAPPLVRLLLPSCMPPLAHTRLHTELRCPPAAVLATVR